MQFPRNICFKKIRIIYIRTVLYLTHSWLWLVDRDCRPGRKTFVGTRAGVVPPMSENPLWPGGTDFGNTAHYRGRPGPPPLPGPGSSGTWKRCVKNASSVCESGKYDFLRGQICTQEPTLVPCKARQLTDLQYGRPWSILRSRGLNPWSLIYE